MKFPSYLFKLYMYICLFVNECTARNKSKFNYQLLKESAFNRSSSTHLSYNKNDQINTENVYSRTFQENNSNNGSLYQNSNKLHIFRPNISSLTNLRVYNESTNKLATKSKGENYNNERKKDDPLSNGINTCFTEDNSQDNGIGKLHDDDIDYHMNSSSFKVVSIPQRTSSRVIITSENYSDFFIFEAHSQMNQIILSYIRNPRKECLVNDTNAALVIPANKNGDSYYGNHTVYLSNFHNHSLSILLIVRNYTDKEPIPGGLFAINSTFFFPHPYLNVEQNLLTTTISFPLASLFNISDDSYDFTATTESVNPIPFTPSKPIFYRIYLSYLYEGDLFEDHYRDIIIKTSTVEGLKKNSTKVLEINQQIFKSDTIREVFVSYSGVGTVVTVVASFNDSMGVRYSSSVFYGCDFIDEAKYNCTKLVSSFAKLFCASLLFIGVILLLVGHRWLNFTMFISGFLASWFILFVTFVQIPNPDLEVLGILTMFGAIFGGSVWLFLWHKFHRPFYSALLSILICSFLAAMISTHFLKYAIVPTPDNIITFVLFPVAFCAAIIGYSIFDIKKVHIMSCCLIGSYGIVMPFAFYFGSSLTYIVINVISLMSVKQYSQAVGFPPFQRCDIILLCLWILIFIFGIGLQVYRERLGPPFYPPNRGSLNAFISAYFLCREKLSERFVCCTCCRNRSDNDSLFEDRPPPSSSQFWSSTFPCCRSSERPQPEFFSAYESFPRIGTDGDEHSVAEVIAISFRKAFAFIRQAWIYLRQKISGEEILPDDSLQQNQEDDIEPLGNCFNNNREWEIEESAQNRIQ